MKQAKFNKRTRQKIRIVDDLPRLARHLRVKGFKVEPAPKENQLRAVLNAAGKSRS